MENYKGLNDLVFNFNHTPHARNQAKKTIFILEDDLLLAKELSSQISHCGYQVTVFNRLEDLYEELKVASPCAMIVDFDITFMTGKGVISDPDLVIQSIAKSQIPVIAISEHDDLRTRLVATKAGATAYFVKPIDFSKLIDKVTGFHPDRFEEPYRILLLNDESASAQRYMASLQEAGMRTHVIADASEIMGALVEFQPDLILMELYLQGCTGLELAAVIRQQEPYFYLPILFVTKDFELAEKLKATFLINGDFLTTPIQINHLIRSVTLHAERSRFVQSHIVRDPFTGLLNRKAFKEQLELEVARAKRRNTHLALAIIDIDDLKSVNKNYGFSFGNLVIQELAKQLKQRFRRTDVLGRYGEDEFALVLPDAELPLVQQALNKARDQFKRTHFKAKNTPFSVTFSCGLSGFPHYTKVDALFDAAWKALLQARNEGGNQIVLADTADPLLCLDR